jgi:serine/threonine protein kinase
MSEEYKLSQTHLQKISKEMAHFLRGCLQADKNKRLTATSLSQHPVFNPVRSHVDSMMKEVVLISQLSEVELLKKTVKVQLTNEITKYSFLRELAEDFESKKANNCTSMYMLKHAFANLHHLKNQFDLKTNFLNHPNWDSFCRLEEYQKSAEILATVKSQCEKKFNISF